MGTYLDNAARPTQTVKACNGAIYDVEHGIKQMPFKTVYAARHGQQSHEKFVMHTYSCRQKSAYSNGTASKETLE